MPQWNKDDLYTGFMFQGFKGAFGVRFFTGKLLMTTAFVYATAYYFKYNDNVSTMSGISIWLL